MRWCRPASGPLLLLQAWKAYPVVLRSGHEVGSDIEARHANVGAKRVRGSESFDHGGGERSTLAQMTLLKPRHRPRQLPEMQHLDVVGQGRQSRQEPLC